MTACEKFDLFEHEFAEEGFSVAEISSLAEYCIIADEFKTNYENAEIMWKGYCTKSNGLSVVDDIRNKFAKKLSCLERRKS